MEERFDSAMAALYKRLGVQQASVQRRQSFDAVSHVTEGAIRRGDRTFQGRALCCLSTDNALRFACIKTVTHPRFDMAVLLLILVNTIFLVLDDPLAEPDSAMVRLAETTDYVFLGLFTLECVLKIIAMGFIVHKHTYLRDCWNIVDFVIVVSGHANLWLPVGSGDNVSSLLRLVRVFRPLRSINRVPGMRRLVNTLFSCLPIMVDVVLLAVLIFYLFSLVGVVLWNDTLHTRCWLLSDTVGGGSRGPEPSDTVFFYSDSSDGRWGRVCGNSSVISYFHVTCPGGVQCRKGAPPPYSYANFDHIGKALLLVFQCVTLDGWITHAYAIEDGWSPIASLFFILLTLFGAYFFANLILAVVTDALTKHVGEEADKASKPQLTTNMLVQHEDAEAEGQTGGSPAGAASPQMVDGDFYSPGKSHGVNWDFDISISPHHDELPVVRGESHELEAMGPFEARGDSRALQGRHKVRGTHVFAQIEWQHFINGLSKQAIAGLDNYKQAHKTEVKANRKRARTMGPQDQPDAGGAQLETTLTVAGLPPEVKAMMRASMRRSSEPGPEGQVRRRSVSVLAQMPTMGRRLSSPQLGPGAKSFALPKGQLASVRVQTPSLLGAQGELAFAPGGSLDVDRDRWKAVKAELDAAFRRRSARKAAAAGALCSVCAAAAPGLRRVTSIMARRGLALPSVSTRRRSSLPGLLPPAEPSPNGTEPAADGPAAQPLLRRPPGARRTRQRTGSVVSSVAESARSFADSVRSRAATEIERARKAAADRWREERLKHGGARGVLQWTVTSQHFMNFISACILVNAIMLSIEHYDMSPGLSSALTDANLVITIVFVAETVLKLVAFGLQCAKDGFNVFDFFIAAISLVEVTVMGRASQLSLLRVMRLFRVLRVLKLARRWHVLQRVVDVIAAALSYIGYLLLLIALFIFIFAVLGRAILAGKLRRPEWCHTRSEANCTVSMPVSDQCEWRPPLHDPNCTQPDSLCCRVGKDWGSYDNTGRAHFDGLLWAALHVFQILTKDNWALLCFRVMREVGGVYVSFFTVILILGTYLLFSMFIAILLVKLGDDGEQREELEKRLGIEGEGQDSPASPASPASASPSFAGAAGGGVSNSSTLVPIDKANLANVTSADSIPAATSTIPRCDSPGPAASPTSESPRAAATDASPRGRKLQVTRTEAKLEMMKMAIERKEEMKDAKRKNYRARRESVVSQSGRKPSRSFMLGSSFTPLTATSKYASAADQLTTGDEAESASIYSGKSLTTTGKGRTLVSALKGTRRASQTETDLEEATRKGEKRAKMAECPVVVTAEPSETSPHAGKQLELDELLKEAKVLDADEKLLNFAEDDERSDDAEWEELEGRSCFIFGPDNALRIWLTDMLLGRWFEYFISYAIIGNCMLITLNANLLQSQRAATIVRYVDWGFTGLFTIEMIVRCIVNGAFIEAKAKGPGERKTTYLRRHKWNVVDAAIVGLSLVAIPFELEYSQDGETPTHISTVTRMIKAARAFRPLRILVRTKRMKVVIGAFVNTIPAVFNVLAVAFVLYFVFGIAGTQLLSGAYRRCSDGSDRNRTECESTIWNATRFDGVYLSNKTRPGQNESDAMRGWRAVQSEWINPLACSFDNLLLSWMTLLEVASLSGWVDIMYEAADSPTATDGPPVRNNSLWATVFFVLWIFAGAYCVMNIFTGVVVDHFTRKKLELSGYGSIFLTMEQEQSLRVKRILSNAKAKKRRVLDRNATLLNKCCYIVVCNPLFPKIILLCILANMGLMATIYHGMSEDHIKIQTTGNLVFTVIFTIEMFLEIGIAGVRAYLRFRWCRLDCAIVLISWAEFITGLIVDAESSASVVQILRLGRGIRVLKHFKGLRDLLMTLYYSLPAFYNISSLLLLMFFMYGVLGTALFEDVRVTDSEELYPIMLSQVANFRNFPRSVLTLYRVATMDSWIRIIKGCQLDEPYCSKEEDNCGDTVAAFVYFTTFQLIVGFVMMNLFIAVVLENFRESVLLPEDLMRKMDQITLFRDVWSRYDPQGRQYIDAIQFVPLMKELPRPIGLADCPQRVILPSLQQLDFPVTFPDQRVLFVDAIDAVGEVVFDIKLVDSLATRKYLRVVGNLDIYLHGWTIAHFYSACVIQTAFRNYCTGQPITGGYLYEAPSTDANLRAAHRELRKERRQNEERLLEESRRRPSLMKHGHPGESTLGVPRPSRRPSQERREQDGLASSVRIRSGVTMVRVASLAASGRRRPSEPTEVTDAVLPKLRHDQAKDIAKDLGKDEEVDDLGEYNLEGHMQRAMSVSARPGTRRRGSTTLSNPPQSDPPRSPQAAMSRVGSRFGRAARAKPAGVYGVQRPAEEDDSLTRRDSGGPQPIQGRMLSLRSDRSGSLRQLRKQLQKPSGSGEATKAADISSIRVRPVQPPTPPAAPSGQEMMEGVEVVSECGSDLSWSARPRRTSPARSPASSPPATTFNPLAGGRRGAPQLLGAAPRAALGPGAEYRLRLAAPAAACAGALATAAAAAAGRTRQRQETMPQAFQLSLLSRSQNKNRPAVIDLLTANGLGSLHGIPEVYSVNVGSKPSKSIMSDPLASPAGAPAPGPLSVSALRPPGQQQQQQTSRVALGPTTSLRSPAQLAPSPASAVSLGPALAAAAGSRGSGKPPQQALLTPARDSTAELWPPPRRPSPGPGESALRAALGPRGVATSAPAPAPAAPPAPSSCVAPPEAPTAPEPLSALSPGSVPISSPQWASPSHPPKRRPGPHGVRVAEPQRVAAPRRGKRRAQQQQQQQQPAASAVDARELLLQAQQHLRKMRGGVATFDALPKQQQQHQHQQQQQQQLPALQPAAQRPEAPSPASPPASAPAALPGVLPGLSPLLPAGTPAVASPVGPALWGSPTVLL